MMPDRVETADRGPPDKHKTHAMLDRSLMDRPPSANPLRSRVHCECGMKELVELSACCRILTVS